MATKLGEKIRSLRNLNGLTLEGLAKSAGLSKSYLWELENRESLKPSAEKLQSIAGILGVDVSFFLDDSVDQPLDDHKDKQFFRSYSKLEPEDKEQLRRILETFKKSS
ncbi:MAG: helix-turn-helix transcriptional regulator [Pseudomonadota bacterium]